ncbi:MAG: hypothetical protein WC788_00130 [Candidatus Paceibacterota bacterium]
MSSGKEKKNKKTVLEWVFAIKGKLKDMKERSLRLYGKNIAILTIILAIIAVLVIDYIVSRNFVTIIYGIIITVAAALVIGIFWCALEIVSRQLDFDQKIISIKNIVIIILLLALPAHFFIQAASAAYLLNGFAGAMIAGAKASLITSFIEAIIILFLSEF